MVFFVCLFFKDRLLVRQAGQLIRGPQVQAGQKGEGVRCSSITGAERRQRAARARTHAR